MWSYPKPGTNRGDNSNTQFALLGLYEAERAGVPVNDKVWRLVAETLEEVSKIPTARGATKPDFRRAPAA